jgi:hypothetical protein
MTCSTDSPVVSAKATLQNRQLTWPCFATGDRYSPCECAKDSRSLRSAAHASEATSIVDEDCDGNEAREPENHRNRLNGQDDERVVRSGLRVAPRDYDQVDERQQSPDCAKDEEVDLARR